MYPYTIRRDHPVTALAGHTVYIRARLQDPEHGNVLIGTLDTLDGRAVILCVATNPDVAEAYEAYEADLAAMHAARTAATPKRSAAERLRNEGGEGYGSPLNEGGRQDNTPRYKGDNLD